MKRLIIALAAALIAWSAAASADAAADTSDAPSAERARQILDDTRPLAEKGDASAQYNMGVLYDQGYGVDQNYATARQWYLKAAKQHYAKAEHNLGIIYESGKGVTADASQAADWFRRAAEDGEPAAQNNLAVMYVRGEGVPRDLGTAARWAAKAASAGNQSAIDNLPEIVADLPHSHVNGDNVNVRAEPNKTAKVVRQADSAHQLVVLKHGDDWTQVLFPQSYAVGWVANFLLADSQAPLAHAKESKASTATSSTAADTEQAGQSAPPAQDNKATDASTTTTRDTSAGSSSATADNDTTTRRAVGASAVNVRSKPSGSAAVVFQAHRGDILTVLETQKGWRYVSTANGKKGWVAGFLLTSVPD